MIRIFLGLREWEFPVGLCNPGKTENAKEMIHRWFLSVCCFLACSWIAIRRCIVKTKEYGMRIRIKSGNWITLFLFGITWILITKCARIWVVLLWWVARVPIRVGHLLHRVKRASKFFTGSLLHFGTSGAKAINWASRSLAYLITEDLK